MSDQTDLEHFLLLLLHDAPTVARALAKTGDPAFCAEQARRYIEACAAGRADIRAFHPEEGLDGPERLRQVKLRLEEGIPTVEDLGDALAGEPEERS